MQTERRNCSRGLLKCRIRGHNHDSTNLGIFFGYSEDICNVIQSVRLIDQSNYIRMYKELNSSNINRFLNHILKNCHEDYIVNAMVHFITIFNILNTNEGRYLLARNSKLHLSVNIKLREINDLPEYHQYNILKKLFSEKLDVEIFHERMAYFYLCRGKNTFFSDFSEKVDDSDNLFSEVVKFL